MSVLNQATRQHLLDLLARLPVLDSRQGRDLLLRDLPADVVRGIERSEATAVDLDHIVYAADSWWPTDGAVADYPLRLLVQTAIELAAGSEAAPALQAVLASLPPTLDPSARPRCPYPGMVPFAPEDSRFFYGREPEIAEMLRRLRVGHYLLVIGPSGSGKSSLVTAGLLPALVRQQAETWHVVTLRPGATPGTALAQALDGDPAHPAPAVRALLTAPAPATRLLVVVDPFEELFTQAERAAQSAFLTALTALRAVPTATLVLLMRADFYPDLMQSVLWPPGEGERLEIAPLHGDALRAAITRPAADVGVEVEPDLVERLVADAADEPGSLPLLQEALVLLWEQLCGRSLCLADYTALGQGERSGLAMALATRADATYNGLTPAQQAIARRIFLRLIAFGEGRPDTRRQQPMAALQVPGEDAALFTATLAALTGHRLLTTSGEGEAEGARRVDIGHEALIRGWPLLQHWIAERRTAEQTRRRLEDKAAEWVRLGQKAGGLLDAAELPEAARWLASADADDLGTSTELHGLVTASRRALGTARQRLIGALAGTTVLLVLAIVAGVLAWQSSLVAQRQARQARAQTLAANAVAQVDRDPELNVLLAMQSISTTRAVGEPVVSQAEDALRTALLRWRLQNNLRGHTQLVTTAWFSPDGRSVITASEDGTAKLWNVTNGQERTTLHGHTRAVTSVAFSPDGRSVVTASEDGTAKLWDATTGQERTTLRGHTAAVTNAAFSPDGRTIVTASEDTTAKLWDMSTGQERITLRGHNGAVYRAAFSPDGRTIVTASWDGTAKLWDATTGQERTTLRGHTAGVWSAAFSPDGRTIVTASADTTAKLWDAATGQQRVTLRGHTGAVYSAAFSPDGRTIVTASEDTTAKLWDAATGQERTTLRGHTGSVNSAAFSPDGLTIVTASWDGTAKLWDVTTGQERTTLRGHSGGVISAAFSPDGRSVITASEDGTAKLWDVTTGQERTTLHGHTGEVYSAVFSPDGRSVVTASTDTTAKLWDAATGQQRTTLRGHTGAVYSAAFSPDGRTIVTASEDTTAKLWDAATGQERTTLRGHRRAVLSAAFSPDGRTIVTASADTTAKLWDAATGQQRTTLRGHTGAVYSAAFSPDGRTIVTASEDTTAKLWDVATGQQRTTLRGHTGAVISAAFSPDGRTVVTASEDGTAKLWDAATGQERTPLRGHTGAVDSAAFSPDGRSVVTASEDGTAKLWDATTGQERTPLRGHTGAVTSAAFSPDGRTVVTASADGTARQYIVPIAELLALAETRVTRDLSPEERAQFLNEPLPTPTPPAASPIPDVTNTP